MNGKGASHADIVVHYQFEQFKRSEKELADLDVADELAKMGLMNESWHEEPARKPYITSRLMTRKLIQL